MAARWGAGLAGHHACMHGCMHAAVTARHAMAAAARRLQPTQSLVPAGQIAQPSSVAKEPLGHTHALSTKAAPPGHAQDPSRCHAGAQSAPQSPVGGSPLGGDVCLKRSSTSGRTWGPLQVVGPGGRSPSGLWDPVTKTVSLAYSHYTTFAMHLSHSRRRRSDMDPTKVDRRSCRRNQPLCLSARHGHTARRRPSRRAQAVVALGAGGQRQGDGRHEPAARDLDG